MARRRTRRRNRRSRRNRNRNRSRRNRRGGSALGVLKEALVPYFLYVAQKRLQKGKRRKSRRRR